MDKRLHVITNPLAKYYLSILRDKNTPPSIFRQVMENIGYILGYELSRELSWKEYIVETPLSRALGVKPSGKTIIIGILGASIPLVNGLSRALPWAGIGLIAAKRLEKENKVEVVIYYERLPVNLRSYDIILADPMLATGKTIEASIKHIIERGGRKIIIATVLSSNYGVEYILNKYSNVVIYTVEVDPILNKDYFIVPGLGDAGDRGLGVEMFV